MKKIFFFCIFVLTLYSCSHKSYPYQTSMTHLSTQNPKYTVRLFDDSLIMFEYISQEDSEVYLKACNIETTELVPNIETVYIEHTTGRILTKFHDNSLLIYASKNDYLRVYNKIIFSKKEQIIYLYTLIDKEEVSNLINNKCSVKIRNFLGTRSDQEFYTLSDGRFLIKYKYTKEGELFESYTDYKIIYSGYDAEPMPFVTFPIID